VKEKLINFEKLQMIARRIREFSICIKRPYVLSSTESVKSYLLSFEAWSETDLFR
jgi:hypothetical protein